MNHISRVEIFLEVAKQQSFIAAARKLGMTGPAVSKQVHNLEEYLGVRLLNRTTRQVTLTEEGSIYNQKARRALEDLCEAEQQIQELKSCPTGILKINAPMAFGRKYLIKIIASFAKKYPDVKVEIDFDDRHVDIIAEGYDVVVRIDALQDSSLISRKLATCPILLCASKDFIKAHGKIKLPQELGKLPAIIHSKHSVVSQWQYQDNNRNVGNAQLDAQMLANNADMMLESCLQGVGIALLPIFTASEYLKAGQLIQILPEYKTYPERGIYAIFPQKRHLSTKVRLFIDCLTKLTQELPW